MTFFIGAKPNSGVVVGHCVILSKDNELVYAGPIKSAPTQPDTIILLNPTDLDSLAAHIERSKE